MRRTVGAALILLTSTVTACSPSDPEPEPTQARSWLEFEACHRAFGGYDMRSEVGTNFIRPERLGFFRSLVEDYRDTGISGDAAVKECEKVMPLSDLIRLPD